MPVDLARLCIEPLHDLHRRDGFCCSNPAIQNFCRDGVARAHRAKTIRAFVARDADAPEVLGYYYLTTTSVEHRSVDRPTEDRFLLVDKIPAVYMGMLGVHRPLMGQGIGSRLMFDAFARVLEISESAGVWALTLDSEPDVVGYYERFGFQRLAPDKLEMFIPLGTMAQLNLA